MKNYWILTSIISGLLGGIITFILTGYWKLGLIAAILILVIVWVHNPKTRYMKAFYVVLLPLLSNIYFTIETKTENFNVEAGLKELDLTTVIVLGLIAFICLVLDYLERNGKLKETFLSVKKNKIGDINGSGNQINQTNV